MLNFLSRNKSKFVSAFDFIMFECYILYNPYHTRGEKLENCERTFVLIKPDGVKRGLIGEIISRIERKGYKIAQIKIFTPWMCLVEEHYKAHKGKDFYRANCDFVASGPVVAIEVRGPGVVAAMRKMAGATKPEERLPGTIRGDLAIDLRENLVHTSDSPESAAEEIRLWFEKSEEYNDDIPDHK